VHLALVGDDGLATVAAATEPTAVVPAGPGGDALAARLLADLDTWAAAGRPGAADWTLVVHPGAPPERPGPRVVVLPHAWVACAPR
jgi:protein-L-isoaspartate(D-aspartate) O-methyltransferase